VRAQVCAYPLGTRLAYMQPGADRAHRSHAPGRNLDRECLCAQPRDLLICQRGDHLPTLDFLPG
jgi:hypothetical protein